MVTYNPERALELLRIGTGLPGAVFRTGQEDAIRTVVEGTKRLLVVQKTGWGKSFVYFIATRILRESGWGPSLLVSPLLALMRNQILAAERMGVRARTIHSGNTDEWEDVERAVRDDEVDVLLISPERLANERFRDEVLSQIAARLALLVVDEAHCISDWGHDFRPHYRLIERIVRTLPSNLRVLATTATANNRVMDDLSEVLGPELAVSRGDLSRPSLFLQTLRLPSQAERLAWLADAVPRLPGHGVIYTLTVRDADRVAEWLRSRGLDVESYTGETGDRRPELEEALLTNRIKALVATTALGMGFDKPDLGFVIHYQTPGSVVAYYQQVGRAGRALDSAYGILLSGREETDITDYFIETAFPTPEQVNAVLHALDEAPQGLSTSELLAAINISRSRIEKTISLLSLESPAPIAKQGTKWQLTAADLSEEFWQRAERLIALRRAEQQQMQEYVRLPSGHMEFLIEALDGDVRDVRRPELPSLSDSVEPQLAQEAIEFLRRSNLPFVPRQLWPPGGMPAWGVSGRIKPAVTPGMVLSQWGDAGWGSLVRSGKYQDGRFADDLVAASCKLIEAWAPDPFPEWLTCVPSRRHPDLMPDFSERLAAALGVPFALSLVHTADRPPQKSMRNGTQQARNIDGALAVAPEPRTGPVLLVDDIVDSRWTLTAAAWLLRSSGVLEVWPFALAEAGPGS
jgi:ATP-dependent DNA helicase RecQ